MRSIIIAVTNQKGGVGKTTTAVNLAVFLNELHHRTLLIDVDPQVNSSDTYRAKIFGEPTLYDLLLEDGPITEELVKETIQHTDFGDIIPGDPNLTEADDALYNVSDRYFTLKNLLEKIDGFTNYDYIILDTNPSLNTLLKCALCSANWAILPCKPTRYAVQGMATLSSTLVGAQQEYNPELKVAGILPVDFDGRANVYRDTLGNLEDVAKKMGTSVFSVAIRRSSIVDAAQDQRMPLLKYAPKSKPALDYREFGKELLTILGGENNG